MQIGSSLPPFLSAPSASSARPLSSDVSPDIARADQAPVAAPQEQQADSAASGREEADRDTNSSTPAGEAEPSPQEQRQQQLEIADLGMRLGIPSCVTKPVATYAAAAPQSHLPAASAGA